MNAEFAGSQYVIEVIYLIASALFILSLKWMSSPATARHDLIDEVATRIWHFESNHKITDFKGTYEDYQAAVVAV